MHETAQTISDIGVTKASAPFRHLFVLGILAGAYISLASSASTMAAFNLLTDPAALGYGRCLAGVIFPVGLILIALAGGELFTGNTMMLLPLTQRKIGLAGLLRNWYIVYVGNFLGAVFVAWLVYCSGQLNVGNHLLGGVTIRIAAFKCSLTFSEAFALGILCNWLVCLAVWIAALAKDIPGKVLAVFFPVWVFVTAGFEHSIANMYFIPVGLLAKLNPNWVEAAQLSSEALASLTWTNFFVVNLFPVTLGNIVGGGVFVALAYGYAIKGNRT